MKMDKISKYLFISLALRSPGCICKASLLYAGNGCALPPA